jgi:hypothetical protein
MKQTLTDAAMIMVMTRLWKEALATIESLLVPPLSDKPSQQRPLTQQELDIVFKWLKMLFEFFNAADEEGNVDGVPVDVLKSPKYHELQNLNFFYFEQTEDLIRTSEAMAAASARRAQEQNARMNRMSAPASMGHQFGGAAGLVGMPTRKHKTIMLSRNLGTMKKAKEEKRKEAQAEPNDDMILRILRMRPEAERYLKDRSRQKVRHAFTFIHHRSTHSFTGTSCRCAGRRSHCPPISQRRRWSNDRRHGTRRYPSTVDSSFPLPPHSHLHVLFFAVCCLIPLALHILMSSLLAFEGILANGNEYRRWGLVEARYGVCG